MSDSESSDVSSVESNVSRRSSRLSVKRVAYSEQSGSDDDESIRRRLEEVLGSDSGSDKEYIPEPKRKRAKSVLQPKETDGSGLSNVQADLNSVVPTGEEEDLEDYLSCSSRGQSCSTRGRSLSSESEGSECSGRIQDFPTNRRGSIEDGYSSPDSRSSREASSTKRRRPDEDGYSSPESDSRRKVLSTSGLGCSTDGHNPPEEVSSKVGKKAVRRPEYEDLSQIFTRPSVLKRFEGTKRTLRKEKVEFYSLRCQSALIQLENDIAALNRVGDTAGVCTRLTALLASQPSLLDVTGSTRYKKVTYSPAVCQRVGLHVVHVLHQHINTPQLRASQLARAGEIMSGWSFLERVKSYVVNLLLNQGALEEARLVLSSTNVGHTGKEATEGLKMSKNILEMLTAQESVQNDRASHTSSHHHLLSDLVIAEVSQLLKEHLARFYTALPLFSWYLVESRDVQYAVDFLTKLRDENPSVLVVQSTLINFLKDQECEEELIIEALDKASDVFPFHDYAVKYCQAVLQKEENLDNSFSSGGSERDLDHTGPDRERIVGKLIRYLDFRLNGNSLQAWEHLVNATLNLVTGIKTDYLVQLLQPRYDWWLQQSTLYLDSCDSFCLGKKLLFFNLALGANQFSKRIQSELEERLRNGDQRVKVILSEVNIHLAQKSWKPLLQEGESLEDVTSLDQGDPLPQEGEEPAHVTRLNQGGPLPQEREEPAYVNRLNQEEPLPQEGEEPANLNSLDQDWGIIETIRKETEHEKNQFWFHQDLEDCPPERAPNPHSKGFLCLTYFKNFLYMSLEDRLALIEKFVNTNAFSNKVDVRTFWDNPEDYSNDDLNRLKGTVCVALQRNLVEKTSLHTILKEVGFLHRKFNFVQRALIRMKKFMDWTRVVSALETAESSGPEFNHFLKKKFLNKVTHVMYSKLNPRLSIEMAVEFVSKIIEANRSRNRYRNTPPEYEELQTRALREFSLYLLDLL